jgi:EamA domain-containing membrane protein RarD
METDPASLDPEERTNKLLALASAALGVMNLCLAIFPICGGSLALAGIGLGLFGVRSESRLTARVGIALNVLALIIAVLIAVDR